MFEEKTIIDQIEITRDGTVRVRFGLLALKDGVERSCAWHRCAVEPGGDVGAMISAVNADIMTRKELLAPAVESDRVPLLKSICDVVHTPEVVAVYREKIEAQMAEAQRLAAVSKAAAAEK